MPNSPAALLPCVEVEPSRPARASVIWLHGLGADGHDFEPIVPELGLPREHGIRFVFPHAPRMPVSVNMGMVMPAWYDIRDMSPKARHDEQGIRRSQAAVEALIAREHERGIDAKHIVLAGFSQGGAIALHTALRHHERLAGLMVLSGYLVLGDDLDREAAAANRELPILQVHGLHDPTVPYDRGVSTCEKLRSLGYQVDFKTYPMQHEVCMPELQDIGELLTRVLSPK